MHIFCASLLESRATVSPFLSQSSLTTKHTAFPTLEIMAMSFVLPSLTPIHASSRGMYPFMQGRLTTRSCSFVHISALASSIMPFSIAKARDETLFKYLLFSRVFINEPSGRYLTISATRPFILR